MQRGFDDDTSDDGVLLRWVQARVRQFMEHLASRHGSDPSTQTLVAKLREVRLLSAEEASPRGGSWKNGKFKHSTGQLFVAVRDPRGRPRSHSSLLKTVVHELAHATRCKEPGERSHSPSWKQTWLRFLGIATQELGWAVDIKCAECTFYGLCSRSQCPKCNWLQNLCRPYTACSAR